MADRPNAHPEGAPFEHYGPLQSGEAVRYELPVLEVPDEIGDIVQIYIERTLMPRSDLGDAFHFALACYYKLDFLLTWNCRNLANANYSSDRHS